MGGAAAQLPPPFSAERSAWPKVPTIMTTTTSSGYGSGDAPEMIAVSDTHRPDGARSRIAWSAIFAGVVLVFSVELLLNALGAGVGLGLVTPMTGGTPTPGSLGAGAGLWLVISTIIAFVVGGYVAGRLAGAPSRFDAALHGLVVWGLTLLMVLYFLGAAAGGILSGVFHLAGGAASLAAQGVQAAGPQVAAAAGVDTNTVQDQLSGYMDPSVTDPSQMSPQDAQKAMAKEVPNLAAGGVRAAAARGRIVPIIATQQHVSQDEAARRFDAGQARFEQDRSAAEQKATQAAQAGAAGASKASYLTFFALLIGAAAAAGGGVLALPRAAFTTTRRVA